jgi:PAS domain S-box-containing protein
MNDWKSTISKEKADLMAIRTENLEVYRTVILTVVTFLVLHLTGAYDYLLFHSLAEIFSILIGWGIFLIAYNVRQFLRNNYFLFIGVAYFFVAGLDLIHMFAYKGMGIFATHDADLPTQLWIAARYLQSISLLVAPLFITRKPGVFVLIGIFSAIFSFLLLSIFYLQIFPACYVEGSGLTTFKIVSEYSICLILIGALIFTIARREKFDAQVLRLIIGSIIVTIFSELSFTLYISVYGFANFLGHFLKIVAFYLLYRALIEIGLRKPYRLLFREVASEKEALRKSEAEYRNLVDNLNDIIFKIDAEGKLTYVSEPVTSVLGYEPQELVDRHFASFIHPEDVGQFSKNIQHCLEERIYQNEFRVCTKQSDYRRVTSSSKATLELGKVVGVQGIVTDITERRQSELALKESEEKLRLFIGHAPTALAMFDREMRYLAVSRRWIKDYGLGDGNILGRSHYEIFPDIPEQWKTAHHRGLQGEVIKSDDDRFERLDGTVRWLRWEVRPWYAADNNIGGIVIFTEDISERHQAEEDAKKNLEQLRTVLEHLTEGLVISDLQGNLYHWNRTAMEMHGFESLEECQRLLPEFADIFELSTSDGRILPLEEWPLARILRGETLRNWEIHIRRLDRDWKRVWLYGGSLALDTAGAPLLAVVSVTDITERKQVEKELHTILERFYSILSNQYAGLLLVSQEGRVEFANQAFCDLFELQAPPSALQGMLAGDTIREIQGVYAEPAEAVIRINEIVRNKQPVKGQEIPIRGGKTYLRDFVPIHIDGKPYGRLWHHLDITERKRAEDKLRESEERNRFLAGVVESALQPFAVGHVDGSIGMFNKAYCNLVGYTEEELRHADWMQNLTPPEYRDFESAKLAELMATKTPVRYEKEYIRKDGTRVPIELLVHLTTNRDGEPVFYSFITDLTDHKRVEAAIRALNQELEERVRERTAELADSNEKLKAEVEERRQAEQKFRSIFENSLDGLLFLSSSDGSILLANSAACDMLGYPEPDLLKLGRDNVFSAPDWDGFEREKQPRSFRGELNCVRRDGTTFPAEISSAIFHDAAGEERSCVVIRDITQRKKSEEALLKWGQVFEHAQWGIVVSSDDKKSLAFMNPEFAKMHGYTLDVFAPDERSNTAEHIAIANEEGHHVWESKHVRKDGTVFPVLVDATAVKDETGNVLYRVVNVQDITERKQAENVLRRTLSDLSRSNADLQQFAYVASHDLQEPLRNVATCLQMLEKKYKRQLGEDADRYIRFAVDGAIRMKALIQDLLMYSRVATGDKVSESIACTKILDQTLENLRSTIIETGAEITHDPLPTVAADPTQLLQVFQNLIANAIKFCGDKQPHIHVSAIRNAHEWVFSIRDNGIGIATRHLDRIFVIFQRLNKRSEYDGTGIGLAIVKKIIERHGGRVWVESEIGEGSIFYFTIPCSTRAERTRKPEDHWSM